MIIARLGLIPWGSMAGLPALLLDADGDLPDPESTGRRIAAALSRAKAPGVRYAWVRSAPWASDAFAAVLDTAAADLTLCAEQPLDAESWGYRDLHWFIDASRLLRSAATAESIADSVGRLPGYPLPTEVLIRDPLPANLNSAALRSIASYVGGENTVIELQVRELDTEAARKAASAVSSIWRVRPLDGWPQAAPILLEA